MIFAGLQKLTTLDYPSKIACTVFTKGCNLHCPFCHNASLVDTEYSPDYVAYKEFFDFLESRKGLLDGVVISGGEPLYWPDTIEAIKEIKRLGFLVKLDTNGAFPDRLAVAIDAGVDYVAMDIKNSLDKYRMTIGIPGLYADYKMKFIESIDIIKQGGIDYEFRTTLVSPLHTINDIKDIASWIGDKNTKYALQNYENSGDILNDMGFSGFTREEMEEIKDSIKDKFKEVIIRGI